MSKALCKTCGETTENIYCRCACQREPKPQYDIITELKAEIERLKVLLKKSHQVPPSTIKQIRGD